MHLDESSIIDCIIQYQKTKDRQYIENFQQLVYLYVNNWPKKMYSCNEDICHDFVVFILEYTEQIMLSYKNVQSSFPAWFNGVLYYKYCDFSKQGEVNIPTTLIQEDSEQYGVEFVTEEINTNVEYDELLNVVFYQLSDEDKALWLFYYYPHLLTTDMMICLVSYTNKELHEILTTYQELLEFMSENQVLIDFKREQIKEIDRKMAHIQNIIQKNPDSPKNEELGNKFARYKSRRSKFLRMIQKLSQHSMKHFVQLFKDYDTAYRTLKKINHKIKKIVVNQKNLSE